MLEKGLGKILFIDEAYRLAEGHLAKEAMDEIVDCVTNPKFAGKLIVILADYDQDINQLMSVNPGLTSRIPESIQFNPLGSGNCTALLTRLLQKQKNRLEGKAVLDLAVLECLEHDFSKAMMNRFEDLSLLANWANARDVET